MKFQKGDAVVYPGHGVGKIVNLETKEIFGKRQSFFTVQILNSGMKIMLPQNNLTQCGLRKVLQRHQIKAAFTKIEQTVYSEQSGNWATRYRELMEQLKSGEFIKVCEAIKRIKLHKGELSFGERKMIDTARELVAGELMLAYNFPYDKAMQVTIEKVG